MPIIKPDRHTAPVYYPSNNYQVVKYMDLTKFISLLQRQSLFFCRMDYLEDHFEGSVPQANFVHRSRFIEDAHEFMHKGNKDLSTEELQKQVTELYEANGKMKSVTCISCWNIANEESAALWKIYSDFDKGLMITSVVSRIIESLRNTEEGVQMSEIKYIDYDNEAIPDGNHNYPMIHKHLAYSYENELRLLHTVNHQAGFLYDWSKEEISPGKYIPVDVDRLIYEVVISPHAPNWYRDLIADICQKYGLGHKPILKSVLAK